MKDMEEKSNDDGSEYNTNGPSQKIVIMPCSHDIEIADLKKIVQIKDQNIMKLKVEHKMLEQLVQSLSGQVGKLAAGSGKSSEKPTSS